jgi:hypothetical protein
MARFAQDSAFYKRVSLDLIVPMMTSIAPQKPHPYCVAFCETSCDSRQSDPRTVGGGKQLA